MNRIPIACELYSVHKELKRDLENTLRIVAEIGYEGVEFYSGVEKDADRINAALKETGLKVCGWHSAWSDVEEENIEATIAFHKAIGNKFVIVPGLPEEMTGSAAAWRATAAKFNAVAEKLAAHGIEFGYHNHDAEFKPLDTGELAWDILGTETDPRVILQLDNGNAMSGGADSLAVLRKYPKRARTIHFKPYSKADGFMTMIGDDDVPWRDTFDEVQKQGVTDWYIVEYEEEKMYSQIDGIRVCFERLKAMGL